MDPKALIMDYGGVVSDPGVPDLGEYPPLLDRVFRLRDIGIRTALLSDAEALPERERYRKLFDVIVLSGEVGVAKPEAAAFRLTARWLEVSPARCVFVDDLRRNVDGAVDAGMVGVHHHSVRSTLEELDVLFEGVELR